MVAATRTAQSRATQVAPQALVLGRWKLVEYADVTADDKRGTQSVPAGSEYYMEFRKDGSLISTSIQNGQTVTVVPEERRTYRFTDAIDGWAGTPKQDATYISIPDSLGGMGIREIQREGDRLIIMQHLEVSESNKVKRNEIVLEKVDE